MLDAASLEGLGEGIDVAYFLVHAMAGGVGFDERELAGRAGTSRARRSATASKQIVYLGGLGDESVSEHLRSRHKTALALAAEGPPLTYFRAAMVVGARSESYRTLRYLVKRLPVMIAPSWLRTDTQPIAIDDVDRVPAPHARCAGVARTRGPDRRPDVLAYGEMLDRMALAMGVRVRPKLPVPFITPWLSALWLGLVTPVDANVARPLVEGLDDRDRRHRPLRRGAVRDRAVSFDEALRRALAEE